MKKDSDQTDWDQQREKIIGLGESSVRKTYFPQLQQKLDELERFRALLDHTRDSIFLLQASTLAIVDVNLSACREMQCARERLLSASFDDFLPPDDIQKLIKSISSGAVEAGELILVTSLRSCSGMEIPVEMSFRLVIFNDVLYGVAVARDITERKRTEGELKRSEEHLRFASSAAGICIWNWDLTSNELIWNARCKELFGFSPDFQVTYEAFLSRIAEGERDAIDLAVQRALRDNTEYHVEMRVALPDGSLKWVMSKGRGFYDEKGEPTSMHGIALDITDRKNYETELVETRAAAEAGSRAKSQFLANMSHELRTPINGIMGILQLLLGGFKGALDTEQKELLAKADRAARSLLRIIEDILDLSRIEVGKLSLKKETFPIREAISDVVELFTMEAHRKELELSCVIDEGLPHIFTGDAVRIRQVLVNLVGNALKFTDRGVVTVAVTAQSGPADGSIPVTFSVTDTGIGIPREKIESLFKPFTQLDPSDTRRYGGAGLGLAISSRLVEMMGGTMSLQSEEGAGSSFSFTIPLKEDERPATHDRSTAARPALRVHGRHHRPLILIAEDDPLAAELLKNMLEYHGLDMELAQTGREAVDMWAKRHYDLIIMDVQMPKMDGVAATRIIREREKNHGGHIPIMAMTAHAFPEDEKRCRAAGMDAYQTKPLDFDQGINTIISLLREKHPLNHV